MKQAREESSVGGSVNMGSSASNISATDKINMPVRGAALVAL